MPRSSRPFPYRPHPHLLEINAWTWLEELSRRYDRPITLADVPDEYWDQFRQLGFDLIWLMGVWERSPLGRRIARLRAESYATYDHVLPGWQLEQVVGSPYSIRRYRPDPRLGAWKDLDRIRGKLHARGMGLLVDFVPNHTALDHPWIAERPECYLEGTQEQFRANPGLFYLLERSGSGGVGFVAHGKDPYFPPWTDVAQLDYFEPRARAALLAELATIAKHADGVRCDMAMLVLNEIFTRNWAPLLAGRPAPQQEFWEEAVAALPGFIWLAEVYWDLEARIQQFGFQFTYDKRLYDALRSGSPGAVSAELHRDFAYQQRLARFLENHDEGRAAAVFGKDRLPAIATLAATLPGMRFYHSGQLDGRALHQPIEIGAPVEEPPDPAARALYETLLQATDHAVFHDGQWRLVEPGSAGDDTFQNLIAYEWRSSDARRIVVANLSDAAAQGRLKLAGFDSAGESNFFDLLAQVNYPRAGAEIARDGLYVRLEPWRAHLFDVRHA
jgi:Alpha amylase, catalytic domain